MKKSWMNYVLQTSMAVLLLHASLWLTPLYEFIVGRPMDRGLPSDMLLGTASTYLVGNGIHDTARLKGRYRFAPFLMILTGIACTIFAMDSVNGNFQGQPLADNQYVTVSIVTLAMLN